MFVVINTAVLAKMENILQTIKNTNKREIKKF